MIFLNASLLPQKDPFVEKLIERPLEASFEHGAGAKPSFCLIPFRSMGNASGMVAGFYPELLMISDGKQQWSTSNVLVAFTTMDLSPSGEYNALVHPSLIRQQQSHSV
ncbi:hypothetical protein G4V62_04955 [Bacillaceae bacterium SIJ1]|nr:sigma-E processing peptidase SpoIIGA [Litoribacterium kuwaitense]NGP44334.1 hypothetical protein [Litoribacterium kuwaitense]